MAVDVVWSELKAACAALRRARNQTERQKAIAQVQAFLLDDLRRQLVHKWRAWGLVLSSLLHAVKSDAQPYLNASGGGAASSGVAAAATSTAAKPRARSKGALSSSPVASKRKAKSSLTPPKLEYWRYLRNEFAAVHALDGPLLHLDPNGRDCLNQLFDFAVVVIGRETSEGGSENPQVVARLEEAAWETIKLIVSYRVYCAVVDHENVKDVLELGLASLEHGNTIGLVTSAGLRADTIQQILKHGAFDLHEWLPRIFPFFDDWFAAISPVSGSVSFKSVEIAVPKMLEAFTDIMRSYSSSVGVLALRHGLNTLHCIQRIWKGTNYRLRAYQSEYIVQFLALFASNTPETIVGSDVEIELDALLKTLKALLAVLLNPAEIQKLLLNARPVRGSLFTSGGARFNVLIDLEHPISSHFRCAADVIYHHDRLVTEMSEHNLMQESGTPVGKKHARPISTTLAWESLLENICVDSPPTAEGDLMSSSSAASYSTGRSRSSQTQESRSSQRSVAQKQHVSWLLTVLAILCRHGEFYLNNRIGDVMTVMDQLIRLLESKDIDQPQYVALLSLVQLSHLAAWHWDVCGDNLDELWQEVWRCLLRPDLPYAHATESAVLSKDYPGDVVLHLLSNCVSLGLVPHRVIAESQDQVWSLPVFRTCSAALATASRSMSATNTSASTAPVRLLNSLLRCIELRDEKGDEPSALLSQAASSSGVAEPRSLRASLLSALFSFLEMQVFHEKAASGMLSKSHDGVALAPVAYASAVLSFIQPSKSPETAHSGTGAASKLLQSLSQRTGDTESSEFDRELYGFGVQFTSHEDGLTKLHQANTDAPGPHSFSPTVQEYIHDSSFQSNYQAPKASPSSNENFEHLKLPVDLLAPLIQNGDGASKCDARKSRRDLRGGAPSISRETQTAMHGEVARHFARILDDLAAKMYAVGAESRETMPLLARALNVGLVLACLYTELPRPSGGDGIVDVPNLLKKFLGIVADNLKAPAFEQALRDDSASHAAIQALMSFHSYIVILQGKSSLAACSHPSAEPLDLRIPSELRPSIRKVVGGIEEALTLVATGASPFASEITGSQVNRSSLSQPTSAPASFSAPSASDWGTAASSSQTRLTPPSRGEVAVRDAFDDGNEEQRAIASSASPRTVKTISLWCFRVLLLLKKESGLKTVSNLATDVQFAPDYLLALAALLCGVAGCDSLELLLKLVDYATDGASREGSTSSLRGGSFRSALFNSQALTVLKLAGLMHERRKRQHNEDIPAQLVQYTRQYLDEITSNPSSLSTRIGRRAELECLEVFFRLNLDVFGDFIDKAMDKLLDVDFSVRVAAVCGIQSLFFMYPEGGPQLFKDLCNHLLPILPKSCLRSDGNDSKDASESKVVLETGSVEICLTVALALYVSACSSEDVIPEVLVVCTQLTSSGTPLYSSSSSRFLHSWLKAISQVYSYPTLQRLLEDHFCYVWSQYIDANMHVVSASGGQEAMSRSSAKELLERFPMSLFSGTKTSFNQSVGCMFADKVDTILPVGVLYDSIGESDVSGEFAFVSELVEIFSRARSVSSDDELALVRIRAAAEEQLITDLFALSFVLQSSSDPALQELAARMLFVAEAKASTSALSISHLGHVVCKIARFTIWDLARVSDQPSDSDLWKQSITHMKDKYSGFDWTRMNLAELLSEFYVMLLRTELSEPISTRAVHCFYLFVREVESAFESSFVLQQLLLRIAFQSIKQLAPRRKEVARRLTLLVRETCEQFMKEPDIFGKYLSFVIHEISDILSRSDALMSVPLDEDDKGNLEWVVFAVCNNMANGLGKYILDIDAVPMGVSSSLDKLSSLIVGSRNVVAPDDGSRKSVLSSTAASSHTSIRQVEVFVKKANEVGNKFYHQSRLIRSSTSRRAQDLGQVEAHQGTRGLKATSSSKRAPSTSLLRLSTVETSVDALDESFDARSDGGGTVQLIGKLAKTLFYLSSQQRSSTDVQNTDPNDQESGMLVAIADALSAVGSLDKSKFDLNPGSETAYLSRLCQEQFNRGALRETKVNFLPVMYERVLVYLSSLLFEEKELGPDVIQQAVVALKSLLQIDEAGKVLLKCKDGDLKEFLSPFVDSPPSNWSSSSLVSRQDIFSKANVPASQQQHAQLWSSGAELGFDAWIRSITSYLVSKSNNPVLEACATLAGARTEMAVFLFPYALWSVLRKPLPKEVANPAAEVVQAGVSEILKSAAQRTAGDSQSAADDESSEEPLEIVQLLVHSVTFLREIQKAQFVESNGKNMASASTNKSPRSSSVSSSPPHLNQKAYGCLIEVDLLDVALAAIRVKMPYSAMQYVEMWLEEKHGGMIPSLSSSNQVELDEYARRILVDAHSFDNNVDSIYGINDGRTLESQLITYNQEGSYTKALPIYDVSLQSCSDAGAAQRTRLLEGMFKSLRNLGYQNLLQGYLASLGKMISPATKVSPQIEEYKYELAWKSLQWGSAGAALSSSDVAASCIHNQSAYTHQKVLFQALKALAHRDSEHLQVLVSKSKAEILKSVQLSLCGLESTQDSYRALLWLESIRDIEEAGQVVMGSSALGESMAAEPFRPNKLASNAPLQRSCADSATLVSLFDRWQMRYSRIENDFDATDNLLALQEVLIKVADTVNSHEILSRLHLSLASFSRKANRVAVAYSALTKLEQLHEQGLLGVYEKMQWKMEKAKLLWTQQETRSAIWTAKLLQSELERTLEDPEATGPRESLQMLHVAVLTITGKWIASQRSENSQVIIEDYFHKATDLVDCMDADVISQRVGDAAKAHLALANYMADMYHQVNTRVTSREWLAGKRVAEARHRELNECLAMDQAKQMENRAHIHALNKEVMYDHEERTKVEASVDQFLTGALRSYGKGLALSPKAELAVVFRLLSLWFSNQLKADTNKVIQEVIDVVPSYKFVPLSYQIISRIGSTSASPGKGSSGRDADDAFQRALSVLVLKLCEQHPHHALVQLIALKNSGDVEGKGALEFRANVGDAKADGAKRYLEKLRKTDQRELLESLDILSSAYIQLALFDTREYHKLGKKIPLSKVPILGLHPGNAHHAISFDQCLRDRTRRGNTNRTVMPGVLTCNVTPRADMDYSGVVRVLSFEPMFSITDSGIHRPKIIYCFGSDGRRFKQLVKGKDDTRQDLVIEQAFESVNHFLKEDKQTRERKLRLRTYKVVPLSPIAGVLEWVDNTVPWGSYLVGRTTKRLSAHERYHPHEWKHADCRTYLKNATDKLAAYKQIEANFTPVFHHFFLEKFPDPAMWYQRRIAYVQSAAVTSIVGYILGIGDRHSQNILVHEETAELVHIDFGVVFDQGMALFTPETVPFRLTRDIVDGMGVSGCEGIFTRCCEATLQLLRKKSASVVTILEVFVHDPLYRWTLSPLKALRIQEGEEKGGTKASISRSSSSDSHHRHLSDESATSDSTSNANGGGSSNNDAAARALIRVKQKLEGYEDPNGNALSIEGQVKQLISAAQDPHNLCNLFPGWAPWL